MGLKCWNVSSPPRSPLPVIECSVSPVRNICRRLPNLRHQPRPEWGEETWSDSVTPSTNQRPGMVKSDQSEARWLEIWETWTKRRKRKKTVVLSCPLSFYPLLLSVFAIFRALNGIRASFLCSYPSNCRWSSGYLVTQNCREKYKQIWSNNS